MSILNSIDSRTDTDEA